MKTYFKTYEEFNDYLITNKNEVFDDVINVINENYFKDVDKVTIAKVLIIENSEIVPIEILKSRFFESLKKAQLYYETIEEYEKCLEVINLIKKMDSHYYLS